MMHILICTGKLLLCAGALILGSFIGLSARFLLHRAAGRLLVRFGRGRYEKTYEKELERLLHPGQDTGGSCFDDSYEF